MSIETEIKEKYIKEIIRHFQTLELSDLKKYYSNIYQPAKPQPHIVGTIKKENQFNFSEVSRFWANLREWFNKMQIHVNKEASLNELEKHASKYSKWFADLGNEGITLYRKARQFGYTESQILSVLLSKLKKNGYCKTIGSQVFLEFAEQEVFGDKKVNGRLVPEQIAAIARQNFVAAAEKAGIPISNPEEDIDSHSACRNIEETVTDLAKKINKQKESLVVHSTKMLSRKKKQETYQSMQYNRFSLLSIIEQFVSLGRGEVFSAQDKKKGLTFAVYFAKQINKFKDKDKDKDKENIVYNNLPDNIQELPRSILRLFTDENRIKKLAGKDAYYEVIAETKQNKFAKLLANKQKLKSQLQAFYVEQNVINHNYPVMQQALNKIKENVSKGIDDIPTHIDGLTTDQIQWYKEKLEDASNRFEQARKEFIAGCRQTARPVS